MINDVAKNVTNVESPPKESPSGGSFLSNRTRHFVLPKQWESMRKAEKMEKESRKRIVHFEKGDFQGPEFMPAPHIMEACERGLRDGFVRYVPGPGLPELREAIAEEITKKGRPTRADEVLVTMGAKHALTQALLTVIGEGDAVVFPNPGYPPDEFWITYAGGKVLHAPLHGENFEWDMDALESLLSGTHPSAGGKKPKMLIVNTPQRPNGMVVGRLDEMAKLCLQHHVLVLSDEIFSRRVYAPAQHKTIAAEPGMADQSVLVDTFSKTFIMTGFRIGWSVQNAEMTTALDIFQQNSVTNVPAFVQLAGLAALRGPQDHNLKTTQLLRNKRDKVVNALNAMPGVKCPTPDGSFYVFPDIRGTGMTAQALADFLVEEFGVAVVAGTAFGSLGEGHIRLTYAAPDEMLEDGMARLKAAFNALANRTKK